MHPVPSPNPDRTVGVLRALGHPLRFRIMCLLAGRGADGPSDDPCADCEIVCACRLRLVLHISAPDLSHHLNVLKAAGLIVSCREGKLVHYRSRPDALRAILPVLDELVADEEAIRPASREI